jgi:hypothetical protein
MNVKGIIYLIDDILNFGIYKYNLDLLIDKCNTIIGLIDNFERKQYFYDIISDLEQNSYHIVENDINTIENIISIKNFLTVL